MARPRQRSRATRLSTRWLGFSTASTLLALAAGNTAIELASASTIKDTIMRTRGQLTIWADATLATSRSALISIGMWIVPEGTGTTILADPFLDANADWFYYTQALIGYEEHVTDVVDNPLITGYREKIDTKAMRIGDPDTEIQLVVVNTAIEGSISVSVNASGRFLLGQ